MANEPKIKTSGEKLFDWLYARYKKQKCMDTWVENISIEFKMDSLEDVLLRSTVIMVMRRLLSNMETYVERYQDDKWKAISFYESDYLHKFFGFSREDYKALSKRVFEAYEASCQKTIPDRISKKMYEKSEQKLERCHICGKPIQYSIIDEIDSDDQMDKTAYYFSLDHIWPRSLGGETEEWNLQPSHRICNSRRQNIIEASDTHYEHFQVKSNWNPDPENSYWKQLEWQFKLAGLMKANFQCEVCKKPLPIHQVEGALNLLPRDREELLNFFNIQIRCDEHTRLFRSEE